MKTTNSTLVAMAPWDRVPGSDRVIAEMYRQAGILLDDAWILRPNGDLELGNDIVHPGQVVFLFKSNSPDNPDNPDQTHFIYKLWKDSIGCTDIFHTLRAQGIVT